MLEQSPGSRITTAQLAKQVGVSEAALYRHFPSKAKMFEGLIEFIESTLFSRITLILAEETSAVERCGKVLLLLLTFAEKNPGITRILTGDALTGETQRLRVRVSQLFDRLETQLKQILRESEIREGYVVPVEVGVSANLMLSAAEGRISQFVRSDFLRLPTRDWDLQWRALTKTIF
jgi:TetR/AcrR family transcriptional regulator